MTTPACPACLPCLPALVRQVRYITVTLPSQVRFDSGEVRLYTQESLHKLTRLLTREASNPGWHKVALASWLVSKPCSA